MPTPAQMKAALAKFRKVQAGDRILDALTREADRLLLLSTSWVIKPAEGTPERARAAELVGAVAKPAYDAMCVMLRQIDLRSAQIVKTIYNRIGATPTLAVKVPAGYRTPDLIPLDLDAPRAEAIARADLVDFVAGHMASLRLPAYSLEVSDDALLAFTATPRFIVWTAADHKVC